MLGCTSSQSSDDKNLDVEYLRVIGIAQLDEDKLEEAKETFMQLLDLAPKDAEGHANLGLIYLKQNDYKAALKHINKARNFAPENPEIRLILARYYEITNEREKSIKELESLIAGSPDFVKAHYMLASMYDSQDDSRLISSREKLLSKITELKPGNLVPRIEMIAAHLKTGKTAEARMLLEELPKIFPAFPKEANAYYQKTLEALFASNAQEAARSFTIFQNFLKVTTQYQTDLKELKGPEGNLIGLSYVTIRKLDMVQLKDPENIVEKIRFVDVTSTKALESTITGNFISNHIAIGDFNADDYEDILLVNLAEKEVSTLYLFQNVNGGYFKDIIKEAGITAGGNESSGIFADYDNNGHLDLLLNGNKSNFIATNQGEGSFSKALQLPKITSEGSFTKPLFVDIDQDADLDLLYLNSNQNELLRNNSDGSFTPIKEMPELIQKGKGGRDAEFADFDEDGDLDFALIDGDGSFQFFSNERHSRYRIIPQTSGISNSSLLSGLSVGDYNNDGFNDLLLISEKSGISILKNDGKGIFEKQGGNENLSASSRTIDCKDANFVDFDNDGQLDIVFAGIPATAGKRSIFLFHNEGKGKFSDASNILPLNTPVARQVKSVDFDKDGDLDLLSAGIDGKLSLLQNEGGNLNHFLKLRLRGLLKGNNKNNYFGVGAKVEVRAGDLYQSMTVNDPYLHFGLGHRLKADVIRILWPNGVSQNLFFPGSDQDLIEAQELKGSCAFLYTWNGKEFVFFKDMMWKSALGMPLGIMGSNATFAPADASVEYLKIPAEVLKPKDNQYIMQITEELWESAYFDKLELVVIDYPEHYYTYVDERFTPPPYPLDYELFPFSKKIYPVNAFNQRGVDVLKLISKKDDQYINNFILDNYQGVTEAQELILDFGKQIRNDNFLLFLHGWLFPSDASINVALGQNKKTKVHSPELQLLNKQGKWQTIVPNLSFPMGKDKTMVIDLSGKFLSDERKVRIRTNMEIYWDEIFAGRKENEMPLTATRLKPINADLHHRGFSRMYRKSDGYGPHWFDYADVSKEQKWRDLTGYYTRFGDVQPLLTETDNKLVIMNSGDEITVSFDASELPGLPKGWKREFLIFSIGWIKDGDLNTGYGNTVEPLPFHGMSRYPFGPEEKLPSGKDYQDYLKNYNTRKVDTDEFRNKVKNLQ